MQVSIENSGALERRMNVAIPEDRITGRVREKLVELSRTVRVDGFRPGKVPMKVVERQFGPRVRGDVLGELLRTSYSEALQLQQLRPVADPVFDPVAADEGTGLTYTATFEVYPDISLNPVQELELKRPVCMIEEKDVDAMVEILRSQHATWETVERPARNGDRLVIDFSGTVDGKPLERGSATDHELILGSSRMIDGFESGLEGASAGETRTLNLTFPTPYPNNDELAGKAVQFEITIKSVAEKTLPVVDDAFFEKFGVTEGGVDAFRREVRENMERERDRALKRRFNRHVMEKLREANELLLPQTLISLEAQRLHGESRQNLQMRGVDPDKVGMPGPEFFGGQAQERVKTGLLMAEVIQISGVTAQPARVREMVESMAASYEQPEALVRWYYSDANRLREVEAMCIEEEAVSWLVTQARVEDEPVSFDDLMNPGQTRTNPEEQA